MKQNLGALKPRFAPYLEGHADVCRLSWYELANRAHLTRETNENDRTKNIFFARLGQKYYYKTNVLRALNSILVRNEEASGSLPHSLTISINVMNDL